jgi:broad specificity phosphatase PhoE
VSGTLLGVRLVLVRHGESEHSVRRVVAGPLGCLGLTRLGREQATTVGRRLAEDSPRVDILLSSATARARQTADILSAALGGRAARSVDCDLCEVHPGAGDGLTVEEYAARYGSFDWQAEPDRPVAPDGESWNQFVARVSRTLHRFAGSYPGQRVVAVTHAGFIVWSLFSLFGVPRPGTGTRIDPDFASLTEWECEQPDGVWRLIRYNDTAHLR